MRKQIFVVSDIHGHFNELIASLTNCGFENNNPRHCLIVCGDLFDRGIQNKEVYNYLRCLNNVKILLGNHDLFFKDLDDNDSYRVHFNYRYNGFDKSVSAFSNINIKELYDKSNSELKQAIEKATPGFLDWLANLPFYYETENYIFTHAGFDFQNGLQNTCWKEFVWLESERIENLDLKQFNIHKKLVMGHRPTIILGEKDYDIHYSKDGQKIYIDGGVAYGGKINVLIIEDEEIF
ncbi:MAG TPA: metallophosphoesterase [Haloplasmataceae bacterium]